MFSVPVPRLAVPSRNVTVPVAADGVTTALRVTCWPDLLGLGVTVRAVVEFTLLTVSVTAVEGLVANWLFPWYTAVSEWVPAERVEVVKTAVLLLSAWLPRVFVPSRKVTFPVAAAGETVAVRVTVWPKPEDVGATVSVVVVWVRPTDTVTGGEVLVRKLASPPYTAVKEWLPLARDDVVVVALPFASATGGPSAVVPSKKVTVPVTTPVPVVGPTLAVKVIGWPELDEVGLGVRSVVVGALLTTNRNGFEVLELNVVLPE